MARVNEFDGTGDEPIGASAANDAGGAIDPASLDSGPGTGAGADDGTDGDNYARNADGTVKRNRDGTPTRKRGRKPGSNNRSRDPKDKGNLKASVDALSNILVIVHAGISGVTNTPELALEKGEGDLLAGAAVPVLDLFDFAPDPRFVAVFGLVMASVQVYGPRAYLIRARLAAEKDAKMKRANRPGNGAAPGTAESVFGKMTLDPATGAPVFQ